MPAVPIQTIEMVLEVLDVAGPWGWAHVLNRVDEPGCCV
jgi:hypothetical protein